MVARTACIVCLTSLAAVALVYAADEPPALSVVQKFEVGGEGRWDSTP